MADAGLSVRPPDPAGAGLETPRTMGERARAIGRLRSQQGLGLDEAAQAVGVPVPPVAATDDDNLSSTTGEGVVDNDMSRLGLLMPAVRRTASDLVSGAGRLIDEMTGGDALEEYGELLAEPIGPSAETEDARDERFAEREAARQEGEISAPAALAGDVADVLVETAPQVGASVVSGAAARAAARRKLAPKVVGALGRLIPGMRGRLGNKITDVIVDATTALGAAAPNAALVYEEGYQKALDQGLDPDDPGVRERINQSAFLRTAVETVAPLGILARLGAKEAVKRTIGRAAAAGLVREGGAEGLGEIADMALEEVFLDEELRAKLGEGDWEQLAPWVIERYGRDALIAGMAGAGVGGGIGAPAAMNQQALSNARLKEGTRKLSQTMEPLGLDSAAVDKLAETQEGVGQLYEAMREIDKSEVRRSMERRSMDQVRQAAQDDPERLAEIDEVAAESEARADKVLDTWAGKLGAPKKVADLKREQVDRERRTRDSVTERLDKLGQPLPREVDTKVAERVAGDLEKAEADVERQSDRVAAIADGGRRAEAQGQLAEAEQRLAEARIAAKRDLQGLTVAQAIAATRKDDTKTEKERRREAQREGRERAIQKQTEIEFPAEMSQPQAEAKATEIVGEYEAAERGDTGLHHKLERLRRQRRAATAPEDIDRLNDEIADLEARRGLPPPAVEAARRVLQAGEAVPKPATEEASPGAGTEAEAAAGAEGKPAGEAAVEEASEPELEPAGARRALAARLTDEADTLELSELGFSDEEVAELVTTARAVAAPTRTPDDLSRLRDEVDRNASAEQLTGMAKSIVRIADRGARRAARKASATPAGYDLDVDHPWVDLTDEFDGYETLPELEAAMRAWTASSGQELGAHVDAGGQLVSLGSNHNDNGVMPPAPGFGDAAVTFTHTHPKDTPFSFHDVQAMLNAAQPFRAVLPSGTIEMRPLKAVSVEELTELKRAVRAVLDPAIADAGRDMAQRVRQEAFLQALEAAGVIDYRTPFATLTEEETEHVNRAVDDAEDAIARLRDGAAGRPSPEEAGGLWRQPSESRAGDEEGFEIDEDDADVLDLETATADTRGRRGKRRPTANSERVAQLAADVVERAKANRSRKSELMQSIRKGELTQERIEAGLQAGADNIGNKTSFAILAAARAMHPDVDFSLAAFEKKTRQKKNAPRGTKETVYVLAGRGHMLVQGALELLNDVRHSKHGHFGRDFQAVRNRAGFRFKTSFLTAAPPLRDYLEYTVPESARLYPPLADPDDTSRIINHPRSNILPEAVRDVARRSARHFQRNHYSIDRATVRQLTRNDMLSSKGLGDEGLEMKHVELHDHLFPLPRSQWNESETVFMDKYAERIQEKQKAAGYKLERFRDAVAAFHREYGPDAVIGFEYGIDDRGRIYADGEFHPQASDAVKASFVHEGVRLKDMATLDASASGWQINALMARDHVAAPHINLGRGQATEPGAKKRDLYMTTLEAMRDQVLQDAADGNPHGKRFAEAIFDNPELTLHRKMVKAPIIAMNYGGNQKTFQQKLMKTFGPEVAQLTRGKAAKVEAEGQWSYLAGLGMRSLRSRAPHAMKLQEWSIASIAKLIEAIEAKGGVDPKNPPKVVFSIGPDGRFAVWKHGRREVEIRARPKNKPIWQMQADGRTPVVGPDGLLIEVAQDEDSLTQQVWMLKPEVSPERTARALWANLVQSYDGAILHRAVERYKRATDGAFVTTNHDSFTVPKEHAPAMASAVRESMGEIVGAIDMPRRLYEEIQQNARAFGVEVDVDPFNDYGQYSLDDLATSTPVFIEAEPDDLVPTYGELPELAPGALPRGTDVEPEQAGLLPTAPPTPKVTPPTLTERQAMAARSVDVAGYMEQQPEVRDVLSAVQETVLNPRSTGAAWLQWLEDHGTNVFAPLRRLEYQTTGTLAVGMDSAFKAAEIAVNDSGRNEMLLYAGAATYGQHGEYSVAPGTIGLNDIWRLAGGEGEGRGQRLQDWMQWMVARRSTALHGRGIKTPLTQGDIDAAMALERPEFVQAADAWKRFNDANLQFLRDSGRITQAQLEAMQADEFYVPFYRSEQRVDGTSPELILPDYKGGGKGAHLLSRDPGIKKIVGGDKQRIGQLMHNMVRNSQAIVAAGMRNNAANKAFDLLQVNDLAETVDGAAKKPDHDAIAMWRDGEEKWLVPTTMEAAPYVLALAGLQPVQMGRIGRMMADVAAIFRQSITLTFPFMVRNWIRGAVSTGLLTSGANLTLLNNPASGFVEAYRNSEAAQAFKAQSGMGDFRFGGREIGFGKDDILVDFGLERGGPGYWFRQLVNLGERVGTATELGDRIAAYKTLISKGVRQDEAAYQALSIMNYNRRGGSSFIRSLLPLVPFLNARLQGYARLAEGAVSRGGQGMGQNSRLRALGLLGINGSLLMLGSTLMWAWNAEDEERRAKYVAEPLHRRLNYHILYFGDKRVLIPKAFELGHVFSSIPELLLDRAMGDIKEVLPGVSKILTDTVAMNFMPQAIKPITELIAGYDTFRQAPIESFREQNLEPQDRTTGASELAILLGREGRISQMSQVIANLTGMKVFEMSPAKIEFALQAYGGVAYGMLSTAFTTVAADLDLIGIKPLAAKQVENPFGEVPVLSPALRKAFGWAIQDTDLGATRFVDDLYRALISSRQTYNSAREAAQGGKIDYLNQILERNPAGPAVYKLANAATVQMGQLNREIRQIKNDKGMSRNAKDARLTVLNRARNEMARRVTQAIDQIEDSADFVPVR